MSQKKSASEIFRLKRKSSEVAMKTLADPQLRLRRERRYAALDAVYARCRGRNPAEAQRQEDLLRDARHYALRLVTLAVSDLLLPCPASESDAEVACNEIRDRIVLRVWDDFLRNHKNYSDCCLEIREFEAALWTEGCPSLEEFARAAVQKRSSAGSEAGKKNSVPLLATQERIPDASRARTVASRGNLDLSLIEGWIVDEGWTNQSLAKKLQKSERAISSLRTNGSYHGLSVITRLANLMKRDVEDLLLP